MEKNTTQPYSENDPYNYIVGLIEIDVYQDKQELIIAEYNSSIDNLNLYWSGRVKFLENKIALKEKVMENFKNKTISPEITTGKPKGILNIRISIDSSGRQRYTIDEIMEEFNRDNIEIKRKLILRKSDGAVMGEILK